jgi:cobaltochelatase CobT
MKSRRIRLVENTVERTARMLAREYGIRVVWKGTNAMTDGKTITLPVLPDDAPDELLEAVQGYLDHETAHIIFTDFPAVINYQPKLNQEQHFCYNITEDLRIEEAMGKLFPGAPYNLRKCHEWLSARIAEHWGEINQFKRACVAYFYHEKFGPNEQWYKDVVDDKTKELVEKCVVAVGDPHDMNTTVDAVKAGLRMYEVLKEEAEQEKKEREEREEAAKKAGIAGAGKGQGQPQKGKDGKPIITSVGELGQELSKQAGELIEAAIKSGKLGGYGYTHGQEEAGYLVYSTAGDTVKPMPDGNITKNGDALKRLREESRDMTNVIKTRLVNALRAMSKRRWLGGKEEGKLDTRRLHAAVIGTTDNVYKQLTEKMHMNTVVGMAIDHSGSMDGRKLELAGKAAIVLGDALNILRIPFMVYGYSTESPDRGNVPQDTTPYARWGKLWIRYYRDFDESWEKGALRLAGSMHNVQANTLDAESVKHGIRRLLLRPEKRKILLVLNDGMPFPGYGNVGRCQQHLHDVVASAKAAGVEVVAFGIQDDDVKEYYPNHVVIRNVKDLVAEPLVLLDKMLRRGLKLK